MANVVLNWLSGDEVTDGYGNKVINSPYVQSQAATGSIDWGGFYSTVGRPDWWETPAPAPAPVVPLPNLPALPRPRPWWAPQGVPGTNPGAVMPVDSDVPLNAPGPAPGAAPATARPRSRLMTRVAEAVRTFQTRNTGRTVQVGKTYKGTNGYDYLAEEGGTFSNRGYSETEKAARTARGLAIGEANRKSPSPSYNVSGDNNAFSPQSVQNSERWQTGY